MDPLYVCLFLPRDGMDGIHRARARHTTARARSIETVESFARATDARATDATGIERIGANEGKERKGRIESNRIESNRIATETRRKGDERSTAAMARATARVERGWFAGRGRGGDDGDDERTRDGRARDGNGGANARGE